MKTKKLALVGFLTESDAVATHEAKEVAAKKNMFYFELKFTDAEAIEDILRRLARQAIVLKEATPE